LNADGLKLVTDYMRDTLGLAFSNEQEKVFEKKISERIEELQMADIFNYYLALKHRYKEIELINLLEKLNINETYFYREEDKLEALKNQVFPSLVNNRSKSDRFIHIWSAGCSTGEEPFTIAMMLKEKLEENPDIKSPRVRIMATDINGLSLAAARRGIYNDWSVRHLPKRYIDKYICRKNGGFEVIEELKRMVEFVPLNLNDTESWERRRGFFFDIVFCRNVLMYFSPERAKAVIEGFAKVLRKGGFLFVASTESVTRHSSLFETRKVNGSFVYEKS